MVIFNVGDMMKKAFYNLLLYIFFPSLFPLLFIQDTTKKIYVILMFISYILLTIYFFITYKKEILESINNFKFKNLKKVLLIFIIGISLMILSNFIINYVILPGHISNNEFVNRKLLSNNKIIYTILLGIIIPFIEEIVFRLEPKKHIKSKYTYIIVTSVLFSLLHNLTASSLIELLYFIPYFIMGYTLSVIYFKTNNILYSTLMHSLNNIITLIIVLI